MAALTSSGSSSHGRPIPGTAGEEQLGFGGAALTTSLAAQIRVLFRRFGLLRRSVPLDRGCRVVASLPARPLSHGKILRRTNLLIHRPSTALDSTRLRKISSSIPTIRRPTEQARPDQPTSQPLSIASIFLGNRRIRSDTLKARIFSREGDPYNEETLRRDFQALWNTQFFEDVKLRVEDSPDGPNHKNHHLST